MIWLFLLLTVLPFVELWLLLTMGQYTGIGFTLGFVIVTGILGAVMLRFQGLLAWRNVQRDLREGRMPTDSLLDGVMIIVAAVLLITPGVLTDLVGITLLFPPCRRFYRWLLSRWFKARFKLRTSFPSPSANAGTGRSQVIDSYVIDHTPHDEPPPSST
jgi:UPF0716 protein FxsA